MSTDHTSDASHTTSRSQRSKGEPKPVVIHEISASAEASKAASPHGHIDRRMGRIIAHLRNNTITEPTAAPHGHVARKWDRVSHRYQYVLACTDPIVANGYMLSPDGNIIETRRSIAELNRIRDENGLPTIDVTFDEDNVPDWV